MVRTALLALSLVLWTGCEEPPDLPPGQESCVIAACHGRVEQIHNGGAPLSCVDCHGGNPNSVKKEVAHPTVAVSFNPSSPARGMDGGVILAGSAIQRLDDVDPAVLRFLNPADYRVVMRTCGSATRGGGNCHTRISENSILSTHSTLSGQIAGGLYFGGLSDREARFSTHEVTDRFPIQTHGFVDALGVMPADPTDLIYSGEPERDYFISMGQLCVECHLARDGTSVPGKYTSSGCNACHLLTRDDGRARTGDITQDVEEIGHGALHRFTNLIPDSQCNRCHHAHLQRGLLIQGVRERSEPGGDEAYGGPNRGIEDPENAAFWGEDNYVRYQGGYNLYGKPYPFYVEDEDDTNDVDETPPDIHFEKGMACIDCHTMRELHGNEHAAVRREFETEVRCQSCHGEPGRRIDPDNTPFQRALSRTGGNADNPPVIGPGENGELAQFGKLDQIQHPLTQIARRADPTEARYNPRTQMGCLLHAGTVAARAELAERFAATAPEDIPEVFPGMPAGSRLADDFATRPGRVECFSCHNAWTVNCYGCHMVRDDRTSGYDQLTGMSLPGRMATMAMSVVSDALALGFNTRGRISPMVGTSIFFSHIDSSGRTIVNAHPLQTVDGFSGDGNQHNPVHHHTVRRIPRPCMGCHPRADGEPDDNDALARAVGYGTGRFLFLDGEGRQHVLDRLVGIDFDGDGEPDNPRTDPLGTEAHEAWPIAASTHMALDEDAAALGPGPLDRETINRMLQNFVIPQPQPPPTP